MRVRLWQPVLSLLLSFGQAQGTAIIAGSAFGIGSNACRDDVELTDDDLVKLPSHKFAEYENCLYYKLLERNREKHKSNLNNLYLEPPDTDGQRIPIEISNITIYSIYLPEQHQEAHASGYLTMKQKHYSTLQKWKDERMQWDAEMSSLKAMRLQAIGHIWIPDLGGKNRGLSIVSPEFLEFTQIRVNRDGTIMTQVNFNLQAFCSVDQRNFPNDAYFCNFGIKSSIFDDVIELKTVGSEVGLHAGYKSRAFQPPESSAMVEKEDDGKQVLMLKVSLYREAGILRTLLFVPMAICAALFVASPLLGSLLHQMYFKLFLIGPMELYSLQFLSAKTSQYLQLTPVPKIYIFYEYTLVLTLLSTIITMIFLAVTRSHSTSTIPPPERLKRFTKLFSRLSAAATTHDEEAKTYEHEWRSCGEGLHFAVMLLVGVIYLIGLAAILT